MASCTSSYDDSPGTDLSAFPRSSNSCNVLRRKVNSLAGSPSAATCLTTVLGIVERRLLQDHSSDYPYLSYSWTTGTMVLSGRLSCLCSYFIVGFLQSPSREPRPLITIMVCPIAQRPDDPFTNDKASCKPVLNNFFNCPSSLPLVRTRNFPFLFRLSPHNVPYSRGYGCWISAFRIRVRVRRIG